MFEQHSLRLLLGYTFWIQLLDAATGYCMYPAVVLRNTTTVPFKNNLHSPASGCHRAFFFLWNYFCWRQGEIGVVDLGEWMMSCWLKLPPYLPTLTWICTNLTWSSGTTIRPWKRESMRRGEAWHCMGGTFAARPTLPIGQKANVIILPVACSA